MVVKIAARQSDLARLQAFEVGEALQKAQSALGAAPLEIEYSFRSSLGDQRADDPLWQMPEKGVFTQDFVQDLKNGIVDVVVHSWKDLPIGPREGAKIAATLPRADARDVLLVRKDRWLRYWSHDRPDPSARLFRILTSSPRRVYNLAEFLRWALPFHAPPEIEFVPVRGNIATRVGKLVSPPSDAGPDALVVAKAALDRLLTSSRFGGSFIESEKELRKMLDETDFVVLPLSVNPTAAAQGALAIEVRTVREDILALCEKIDSSVDRSCVEAERAELARHGGGCHQKIGVTCLARPYGRIQLLRGLTDLGVVLNSNELARDKKDALNFWPPVASESEICVAEMKAADRRPIENLAFLETSKTRAGYFVARANAWPEGSFSVSGFVWTAGLATWRRLTAKGVWVHGSSESLGEGENSRVDVLAGGEVNWTKLTHFDAANEEAQLGPSGRSKPLGTYKVDVVPPRAAAFAGKKFFFWKSGSQFRAALSVGPEIAKGYHASGPGHTHEAIVEALRSVNAEGIEKRVAIFLSEADFNSELLKRRIK